MLLEHKDSLLITPAHREEISKAYKSALSFGDKPKELSQFGENMFQLMHELMAESPSLQKVVKLFGNLHSKMNGSWLSTTFGERLADLRAKYPIQDIARPQWLSESQKLKVGRLVSHQEMQSLVLECYLLCFVEQTLLLHLTIPCHFLTHHCMDMANQALNALIPLHVLGCIIHPLA